MAKKTEKKQLLTPPVLTETSTEEERASAADFKKQRLTVLIMRCVFLGLALLACLFSLFIPSMKKTLPKKYGTDYSLTLSVANEVFGTISLNAAQKADADSFAKNSGKDLIGSGNDEEEEISASEAQILADVAYKKTRPFSKMTAQSDIEAFLAEISENMRKEATSIREIASGSLADKMVEEFYKETEKAVGATFDLFSYEIERNNYAGLGAFLDTMDSDFSETTFQDAAKKFLIGNYEWTDGFQTTLKVAVEAATVIPELQDGFEYSGGGVERKSLSGGGDAFQLILSIAILAFDLIVLINIILQGIFLYKHFRQQEVSLKSSRTMVLLFFCAMFHFITFLFTKGDYFEGAFSAGAVVVILFLVVAAVAQIVYNRYLSKMRAKFLPEKESKEA